MHVQVFRMIISDCVQLKTKRKICNWFYNYFKHFAAQISLLTAVPNFLKSQIRFQEWWRFFSMRPLAETFRPQNKVITWDILFNSVRCPANWTTTYYGAVLAKFCGWRLGIAGSVWSALRCLRFGSVMVIFDTFSLDRGPRKVRCQNQLSCRKPWALLVRKLATCYFVQFLERMVTAVFKVWFALRCSPSGNSMVRGAIHGQKLSFVRSPLRRGFWKS